MTTRLVPHKALLASAALLALFAGACQPGEKQPPAPATTGVATPAAAAATAPAPAGETQLARFKTGEFKELDTDQTLTLPQKPFLDAAGKPHTFAEWAGKVVVFNLWGEWCAPCVKEMPSLAKLQSEFPGGDVVVLPIAFGDGPPDKAEAKLKQLTGGALPFHYDPTWEVSYDAHTGAFPSTIIYGTDGKEAARLITPADWGSDQAKSLVEAIRDGAR